MFVTVAAKLAEFLFDSVTSAIVGNAAYDVVKDWWQVTHRTRLEEIYVDGFVNAARALTTTLQHYAEPDARVSVDTERLRDVFDGIAENFLQNGPDLESFLEVLADRIEQTQIIVIPGYQLTSLEYQGLVLKVLQLAWERVYREISYDDVLFRESVRRASEAIQANETEIINAIRSVDMSIQQRIVKQLELLEAKQDRISQEHQEILGLLRSPTWMIKPKLTYESLTRNCRRQVQHTVTQAAGQYVKDRYVNRSQPEAEFSRFLASDSTCYLILGKAGEGKTNLMCYLAETNTPSLLFLTGRQFEGEGSIEDAVRFVTGQETLEERSFAESPSELDAILEGQQVYLLIFVDAINEHTNPDNLNRALGSFVATIGHSRIKLVISCRDTEWSRFHDNAILKANLFNPVRGPLTILALEQASIKLFSDGEFKIAWNLYKSYYVLEGKLTAELGRLCHDPFMLYLLGEAYSNRELGSEQTTYLLPQTATRLQLFDKYWERKAPRHEKAFQHGIYALVRRKREYPTIVDFSSFDVVDLLATNTGASDPYPTYQKLLSEKMLVEAGEERVRFTYDLVYEYASARQLIYQEYSLDNRSDEEILRTLETVLSHHLDSKAPGFGSLLNTVSFVLAILVLDEHKNGLLGLVYDSQYKERFVLPICSLIEQLPSIDAPEILAVLESISKDKSPSDIQYVLARILAPLSNDKTRPLALTLLDNLAESPEALVRLEVVESLQRIGMGAPNDTLLILEKLVDDPDLGDIRPEARQFTWKIIGQLGEGEVTKTLERLATTSNNYLKEKAKKLLVLQNPTSPISLVAQLSEDSDTEIQARASQILWERISRVALPTEVIDELTEVEQGTQGESNARARQLLESRWRSVLELPQHESKLILFGLIESRQKVVQIRARKLLALLEPEIPLSNLARLSEDLDPIVDSAANALLWSRLGKLSKEERLEELIKTLELSKRKTHAKARIELVESFESLLSDGQLSELISIVQNRGPEMRKIIRELLSSFHSSVPSLDLLLLKVQSYVSEPIVNLIRNAFSVATSVHRDQEFVPGTTYALHSLSTALIVAELEMDPFSVVAALLHHAFTNAWFTPVELGQLFGNEVIELADAVARLSSVEHQWFDDTDLAGFRKMLFDEPKDPRVLVIMLADRLDHMRRLGDDSVPERNRLAMLAIEVLAPLARRLALEQIQSELEDLSLKYLYADKYKEIETLIGEERDRHQEYITQAITILGERLAREGIRPLAITGHLQNAYHIYNEMEHEHREFKEIHDIHTIRVDMENVSECYEVLSIVHSLWWPLPLGFDDFIAKPIEHADQSLRTSVRGPGDKFLEIEIRPIEKQKDVNFEVRSAWRYEERGRSLKLLGLRREVFQDNVYVSGPQGGVIALPNGSTPIDLAYHIHTELGHLCRGAKVNGRIVPLDYHLRTGDSVEILKRKQGGPSRDWLNPGLGLVHTARAREKIRQWFKKQARVEAIADGRALLEKELHRLRFGRRNFEEIAKLFNYKNADDFLEALGHEDISISTVSTKLLEVERAESAPTEAPLVTRPAPKVPETKVTVKGVGNLLQHLAHCCNPLPGDEVIGFITRGRGITIHRRDCKNVPEIKERDRLIEIDWHPTDQANYPVQVQVRAIDRVGLVHDISGVVTNEGINIASANAIAGRKDGISIITVTLEIASADQLTRILNKIDRLPNVVDVRRIST